MTWLLRVSCWCVLTAQRIGRQAMQWARSVRWSPLAATVVAFALGLLIGHGCRPYPSADAQPWDRRVQQLLADSTRVQREVADLRATAVALGSRAETLTRLAQRSATTAAIHRQRADSLAEALSGAEGVRDSLTVLAAAYEARSDEATGWRVSYEVQLAATARLRAAAGVSDSQAAVLTARVADLEQALRDRPVPARCRVLGLVDCPSRTAMLGVGLVAGVLLTAGR